MTDEVQLDAPLEEQPQEELVLVPEEQVVVAGSEPAKVKKNRKASEVVADNEAANILINAVDDPIPADYVPSVGIEKMPKRVTIVNGTVIEDH